MTCLAASAVGAPFVGYKRAAFLAPDDDARRVRAWPWPPRTSGSSPTSPRRPGSAMPQAAVNLATIRAAEKSVGEQADFSMVASHLRQEGRR